MLAISLKENQLNLYVIVCIYRKTSNMQIIPDHQNEPSNNINNQRYNPILLNHREVIIIAVFANFPFILLYFLVNVISTTIEIVTVLVSIINVICIPLLIFYFNGKLRQFYLRQFWENAPNCLQRFNPNRIIEINNTDNNIELGVLPQNRY